MKTKTFFTASKRCDGGGRDQALRRRVLATLAMSGLLVLPVAAQLTVDNVVASGLFEPYGVAADAGNIVYITDSGSHRILRFDPNTGVTSTLAGILGVSGTNDGPSYLARLNSPQGIALATLGGTNGLIVGDTGNHLLRFVNLTNGAVSTLAGIAGVPGYLDAGVGTSAKFRSPIGVAVDAAGILYVADSGNSRIRQINLTDPNLPVTTLAVAGTTFYQPNDVAVLDTNQLWIADTRNHAIKLVTRTGPSSATLTTLLGSNDRNLSGAADNAFGADALFNNPRGILWLGAAGLVIADTGNETIRLATNNPAYGVTNYGVVTFAGIAGQSGFVNGPALAAKFSGPHGLARDTLGNGFLIADLANNAIRRLQTGLPQPPVATPQVGWVDFVIDPTSGALVSVLRTDQPFVFNNDVTIATLAEAGTETFFTSGATPPSPAEDVIPSPSRLTGFTPPHYENGMSPSAVRAMGSMVLPLPDLTVKVISTQDGRQSSGVTQARFQFKAGNPVVSGNNAAQFTLADVTAGAKLWFTVDGSEPTNGAPSVGVDSGTTLSLNIISNTTFKVRAFRDGYQPSSTVSVLFSPTNFVANTISFGFAGGEAASDFVGSPGQFFYAPVTLAVLPGVRMYSLQFNITATNLTGPAIPPGAIGFKSMLMKPIPNSNPPIYETIPPAMFAGWDSVPNPVYLDGSTNFSSLLFTNAAENLLGVGWLERAGATNLYDTTKQDLITYSMAHDTMFLSGAGKVVLGGFAFRIPSTTNLGAQYQIQLGRPSATSDGIGTPGSEVYIATPTNGSLGAGAICAVKRVTVGQRKYVVGDAAPFGWFNAGDFGDTNLTSSDVMQVFQSAVYGLNSPPEGSDFKDAMDACGNIGVLDTDPADGNYGNYTNAGAYTAAYPTTVNYSITNYTFMVDEFDVVTNTAVTFVGNYSTNLTLPLNYFTALSTNTYLYPTSNNVVWVVNTFPVVNQLNNLFNGNDTTINRIAFGDGQLDVCDVYVTFRRSLDPSLNWFRRFWTNGVRAAEVIGNPPPPPSNLVVQAASAAAVNFATADARAAAGQTLQIPVTAQVIGAYPLRTLMLNLSVTALDGSPALASGVQFAPNPALGAPGFSDSRDNGNYAATWLNSTIPGFTGTVTLGTLTVQVPTNAASSAAYAVHFDHASASPNGIASFPKQTRTGLITLADRSPSSWNDGIPDSWRLRYFGSVNNFLSAANADADGDGATNLQEYQAGTEPNDPNSVLRLKPNAGQPQECVVRWPSVPGRQYVLERAASLYAPAWTPISTNSGTGLDLEYHDPRTGRAPRFYRVQVLP